MDENRTRMSNFQLDQRANFLALILLDALEDGNESDIRVILARNNVDASYVPSERGISPLHYACGMEDAELALDITRRFLDDGADANVLSNENMTPLHVAAIFGRVNITNLLLEHGARHDMMDNEGKTPMHYAIEECHFEVLEAIRNHIFKHKYERIRLKCNEQNAHNSVLADKLSPLPKKFSTKDDESNKTPVNKVLLNVLAKENGTYETPSKKYTPNRVHYNYDVTSPYYINITHRRHRPQPIFPTVSSSFNSQNKKKTSTEENEIEVADPELCVPQKSINIFQLTEKNLRDMSLVSSNLDRSCISMIEAWREKVQCSRARQSILKQYSNVEKLLEDVMKNEHLNFTNTALQENEEAVLGEFQLKPVCAESVESVDKLLPKSNTSLGTIIQKAAQAQVFPGQELETSYHTVPELPKDKINENDNEQLHTECLQQPLTNNLKSKEGRNKFFLQMTEAYVHTDDENGLVFYETKLLSNQRPASYSDPEKFNNTVSTNVTIPLDYETDELRAELTNFGDPPGPITKSTKKLYIKRLIKYKRDAPDPVVIDAKRKNNDSDNARFSVELLRTIRSPEHFSQIPEYLKLELKATEYFANHQNKQKMREGHLKQSFIYMLVDPRISCNLPGESVYIENTTIWARFLHSVFYVGKGKSSRPYSHLYEAMKLHSRLHNRNNISTSKTKITDSQIKKVSSIRKKGLRDDMLKSNIKKSADNKKLERILDIWSSGKGVVCLHVFHNILPSEAYTREAAIIDAFGLQHLTNVKRGDYYGPAQTWTMKEKKYLGIALLHKAMQIYLVEGESQLSPSDLL